MTEFSVPAMTRFIRNATRLRVSRCAALELDAVLGEYAHKISSEALKLSQHRGAKTITKNDIRAALAGTRK